MCAVAITTCCTWINLSGEIETQLHKIIGQATWFKKVTASKESFFDLFDFDWFGSWRPWIQSALQILEITLFLIIRIVSLVHCILSKTLNACLQLLTTKQIISLRLNCQNRNRENDQLRMWTWHCDLQIRQRDSAKNIVTCEYHREIQQKLLELQSSSWE